MITGELSKHLGKKPGTYSELKAMTIEAVLLFIIIYII